MLSGIIECTLAPQLIQVTLDAAARHVAGSRLSGGALCPSEESIVTQAVTGALEQEQPARDRSRRGVQLYTPAVTASWRMRMLRKGNVPDAELAKIRQVVMPS